MSTGEIADTLEIEFSQERRAHWASVAQSARGQSWGSYYHKRLGEVYRFLIPPGQKILELGSGRGHLLAALSPSVGVGVDFSPEMTELARRTYPDLEFICADVQSLPLREKFDYIILSDLLNDVWDVQQVLREMQKLVHARSRIVINLYSRLWELPLEAVEKLRLARPNLNQNWLTVPDVANLLRLADFEVLRTWHEVLWPIETPVISPLLNRYLVRFWPFTQLALTNLVIAKPYGRSKGKSLTPTVSVVIPTRNEAGNIPNIFERLPNIGSSTEVIFVEGHSHDKTYEAIEKQIESSDRSCKLLRQTEKGKGDAVRLGFSQSTGDVLMILDADLTVPPDDLLRFYEALVHEKGEFINGVRSVYPMEKQAMRFFNILGNKIFSLLLSWILGQPIKDTLCGTKVLWREDYERIAAGRSYFGDFDPFGDFDLIFGAAKLNLRIVDLPIRYRERKYGSTNIQRWKHGWLLLRMVLFAARRVKFV